MTVERQRLDLRSRAVVDHWWRRSRKHADEVAHVAEKASLWVSLYVRVICALDPIIATPSKVSSIALTKDACILFFSVHVVRVRYAMNRRIDAEQLQRSEGVE